MSDATAWLRPLVDPLAADLGVDVVEAQIRGAGPRQVLRICIDRKGGVDLTTCQELSRRVSARLDESDPLPSRYELVVTSPGTDRPLTDQGDFDRVVGRQVRVQREQPDGGSRHVTGTVTAAEDEVVVLEVGGDDVRVPYREIVKATQALPW
ncbi:MAG TPA: ribosome maturation factor RimP [Egibacteraceae bacterium]|nr:ribosome maturation factor RimP [Egibacteraceae bacterium]